MGDKTGIEWTDATWNPTVGCSLGGRSVVPSITIGWTEPPTSAPYPHPAVSHEPRIQQLSDQLEAAGYHPFHAPCGILLDEQNMPYSRCVRCANCDGDSLPSTLCTNGSSAPRSRRVTVKR